MDHVSIVIAGGGSIGTVLATLLQKEDYDVTVLRRSGPTGNIPVSIVGEFEDTVDLKIVRKTDEPVELLFITVQEQHTASLCEQLTKKIPLTSKTILISLQNGLDASKIILKYFPENPIIAGTVWWSAALIDYSLVLYHRKADTVIGIPNESIAKQSDLSKVYNVLSEILSVSKTEDILQEMRYKLILNVVSPILGLVKLPYPEGLENDIVRKMVHALFDEAIETAKILEWDVNDQRLDGFHQMLITGDIPERHITHEYNHKVSTQLGIEKYGGRHSNIDQLLGWLQLSGSQLADEIIQLVYQQSTNYHPINPTLFRSLLDNTTYARCDGE